MTGYNSRLQTSSGTLQGLDSGGGSDLVDGSASVLDITVAVHLHELGKVELGLLQDLDLSDKHILQREDGLALLLDLQTDGVRSGDSAKHDQIINIHTP